VIVAGLHNKPVEAIATIGASIAATMTGPDAAGMKMQWLKLGNLKFRDYLRRGRWERATDTKTKIILGGTLIAAGVGDLRPAILLGALISARGAEV
jgi:hypothetical protein